MVVYPYLGRVNVFPSFRLIGQPDWRSLPGDLVSSPQKEMLILYGGNRSFLERIFGAAGYDQPGEQLHLLEWTPEAGGLDLAGIARRLSVKKIILFGQDLPSLGHHFLLTDYFPAEIAGRSYLTAPPLATIKEAKEAGDNRPAAALWKAIQNGFLREQ